MGRHSGIIVNYPTRLWEADGYSATLFEPDVMVELTLGDYVTGRDPVLQAALTHTP